MLLLALLLLAQDVTLGRLPNAPARFPYTDDGAGGDLGCSGGGLQGSRFPAHLYDPAHRETLMYNVSRCTGGYIKATSDVTGRSWSVDIAPGGGVRGRDAEGHAWRYDAGSHRYVVTATGATCVAPDYRAMCGAAAK